MQPETHTMESRHKGKLNSIIIEFYRTDETIVGVKRTNAQANE